MSPKGDVQKEGGRRERDFVALHTLEGGDDQADPAPEELQDQDGS